MNEEAQGMNEQEVQRIVKAWFESQGFSVCEDQHIEPCGNIDLVAESEDADWLVEMKGDYCREQAQYRINFQTAVGQIAKFITQLDDRTKYAIGIPFSSTERRDRLSYKRILPNYAESLFFEKLNVHLILVYDDETVIVKQPHEVMGFLAALPTHE